MQKGCFETYVSIIEVFLFCFVNEMKGRWVGEHTAGKGNPAHYD